MCTARIKEGALDVIGSGALGLIIQIVSLLQSGIPAEMQEKWL
jgi:hypothetical protein